MVLGLTEEITLIGAKHSKTIIARIDTGARSSSLDLDLAKQLQFKETKPPRIVKSASGVSERPVVHAKVVILDKELEGDFTLADRSHMTYPVLIGQNILRKGRFLVDPLKKEQNQ